jgi:KDO2-lipid IV(A) lauroyltransferase
MSPPGSVRAKAGRFWLWLVVLVCTYAPGIARAMSGPFVWCAWRFSRYTRLAMLANAGRIRPGASEQELTNLGKAALANLFRFIAEMGRNSRRSIEAIRSDVSSVEGLDRYLAARASKRGAILAAAHLGPFECAVASLREHEPHVHVVFMRDTVKEGFEALRARLRAKLGVIEAPVEPGADSLGPWMGLREALVRDEVVLLQADRVMPGQRGVPVPFLGGHLEVPPGPVKLALASGAPIIPVFSFWEKGGVRIVLEEPIEVTQPWMRQRVHPSLLRLTSVIEKQVLARPDQWLMYHPALIEDQGEPR